MRRILYASLTTVLFLTAAGLGRADDQGDIKAVLDKAIKAHGGADKLTKFKASTMKAKGKFYGLGDGIDYTGEWAFEVPSRTRFEIDVEVNGMKIKQVQVFTGEKGWIAVMGNTIDMDKDMIDEAKESMYNHGLGTLVPLKDKAYTLAPLGEAKVGDRTAVGIKVSHAGHRDVNLYFDKDSGMLLKSESTVKDLMAGGKEVNQETLFSDYKPIDGVQQAMKVVINRDGKKYVDAEITEAKSLEKLDESLLNKP